MIIGGGFVSGSEEVNLEKGPFKGAFTYRSEQLDNALIWSFLTYLCQLNRGVQLFLLIYLKLRFIDRLCVKHLAVELSFNK